MSRSKLKAYASQARRDFIRAVKGRAAHYGLTATKIDPISVEGDVALVAGLPHPKAVAQKRSQLESRINRDGFEQTMEAMAYTWFNRFVAIRYMELHGYLDHGYRVLGHPEGHNTPEIVENAEHLDLPGLDLRGVIEIKLDGGKEEELYRMLVLAQCHALYKAMPFLFEPIDDETELLLPDNLLHSDSLIRKLVADIPEEDWKEIEIIGWLYQFYISEKKDEVIGKVVKSEDIPAATQLFTPNWIVKYLVQNSLGRQWMATYPDSPLKGQMEYYIEPAEQTPEVQEQLKAITPTELNPEELTLLDPACGSGHILVEAYDLLKAIYQERGYRAKDIPRLILGKNLYGLEIDDRAAQLAAFALMMKARADDRRIFEADVQPNVLAIQESKGLDAKDITEALNGEQVHGAAFAQADIALLIALFEDAKTLGSLVQIPASLTEKLPALRQRVDELLAFGSILDRPAAVSVKPLVQQAVLLAGKYDSVVANPPYMGRRNGMNSVLKSFAEESYPASKTDLFALFIDRGFVFARPSGRNAMVTMHSWMFLPTLEELRERVVKTKTIESMTHLGARAFGSISGEVVQVVAFVCGNQADSEYRPTFFRLIDGNEEYKQAALLRRESRFVVQQSEFAAIPGSPIAYWASTETRAAFQKGQPLEEVAPVRQGMATADNDRFLRYWFEVQLSKIGIGFSDRASARRSGRKWFPYNKGGTFRKWYGNNEHVVNWEDDGRDLFENRPQSVIRNADFYFKPAITWSFVSTSSFGVRQCGPGFLFDVGGSSAFPPTRLRNCITGFLCSKVAISFMQILNPTFNFQVGNVSTLPVLASVIEDAQETSSWVEKAVQITKDDWDSQETSPGFTNLPVGTDSSEKLTAVYQSWVDRCETRRLELAAIEETNNSYFSSIYGLSGELTSAVSDDEITLYRPDREEDIRRLISYAIGCMMGRFSLDEPGFIYAHCGNQGFDLDRYKKFPADHDGIIPITDTEWFVDDAANRVVEFVAKAWAHEHLEENLNFVAESIGSKKGESSRDTIRRYLSEGFYRHHMSMYKRRPIYWLFSSGKQAAFECLVYLHRYNEGTLSRMRTEYVIPLQGKIDARIEQLKEDIASATSTAHGKRQQKERDKLIKQQGELRKFDEKLRHYADLRISLDLDDGVKVNYGKFGDLLVDVKAITGTRGE
jgi:type II restriction/modification system DNA methylase subunit YeeA